MGEAVQEKHVHDRLIEACRQGDAKSQFALYRLYSRSMYNTAMRFLIIQEDAEDILQEAFFEAFTKISSLRDNLYFGSWLKRITVNKCIAKLKKRKVDFEELNEANASAIPEFADSEPSINGEKIHLAIKELPAGCRTVLSLFHLEGYDHEEISGILGISLSTSKSQLHRARKLLQQHLKGGDYVE